MCTRYRLRGNFLFERISLTNKHVLEVGCGTGAWAIWAALHGADRVVGIEPEAEGSSPNTLATFRFDEEKILHRSILAKT